MGSPHGKEPWWWITRENAWYKLNVAAAVVAGAYLLWDDRYYGWLARHWWFALVLVALVGAVPLIVWLFRDGRRVIAVWAIVATVIGVAAAGQAAGDAREHRYHNCWTLAEKEEEGETFETIACAPESEPEEWTSSEDDPGRFCDYIDPVESEDDPDLARRADLAEEGANVTLWHCE